MTNLYIRPGVDPQPLPFDAHDETGRLWTDLANSAEGRKATGWNKPAPAKPSFDPATQALSWTGVAWTVIDVPPPPPVIPAEVTMRQARLSLSRAGILTAASQAIAAMPGVGGDEARIEWEFAATLRRDHPLVAGLGQILSLNAKAIDNLFIAAAQIP